MFTGIVLMVIGFIAFAVVIRQAATGKPNTSSPLQWSYDGWEEE